MNQAAQAVGIKEAIGTHTLRKTLAIGLIKAAQM
jgi:site-specific recombinase XerD